MPDSARPPSRAPLPVFLQGHRSLGTLQLIRRRQSLEGAQAPVPGHRNDDSRFTAQMDHLMRTKLRWLNGLRGHATNASWPCRRSAVKLHLWRSAAAGS